MNVFPGYECRLCVIRFVACLSLCVSSFAISNAQAQLETADAGAFLMPIPMISNLKVSSFLGPEIDGNLVAFVVSEYQEGSTDLNGDGDASDYVLHVHNVSEGITTNLQFASTAFHLDGDVLAFLVNENSQDSTDFNGDGDALDNVAFVYEGSTGSVTNLGVSTGFETFGPFVGGNLIAIPVSEYSQGGTDLNKDGDTDDMQILYIHDVTTGITTNLGLATGFVTIIGDSELVAFPVSEYEHGNSDLNGDADFFDLVLHIYDGSSGKITNLQIAVSHTLPRTRDEIVVFDVEEFSQGETDFNGDGDISDRVAFIYNASDNQLTNLMLAVNGNSVEIGGTSVFLSVDEEEQGQTDLNGDGDLFDRVVHVYDMLTGSTVNLGLSSAGYVLDNDILAMRVWESGQGFTDLNGDGDFNDVVLHLYDASNGSTSNLGIAAEFDLQFADNLLAFRVSESAQGNIDRNGDGDVGDFVVHTWNSNSGIINNLGLAVLANGVQIDNGRIAIKVNEASQSANDLNGDGDSSDQVIHMYDSKTGSLFNLRRAVDGFRISDGVISFEVPESAQGNTMLNGDRDTLDAVVHLGISFSRR